MNIELIALLLIILISSCEKNDDVENEKISKDKFYSISLWYPSCQFGTYPVDISIDKWQERDFNNPYHYAHNVARPWVMLFNQKVSAVALRFSEFDVENYADKLKITYPNGNIEWHGANPPQIGSYYGFSLFGTNMSRWLEFKWSTDYSVNADGYAIDRILASCYSTIQPNNGPYVMKNFPYDGYLMGNNDVIYVWTVLSANKDMSLYLWPYDENDNFDILADDISLLPSSGAKWSSTNPAGEGEIVLLPAVGYTRNIFIAIGSNGGNGQFRFYANEHGSSWNTTNNSTLFARTPYMPSYPNRTKIKSLLRKTTAANYFLSDGRHFIKNWHVYWNVSGSLFGSTPELNFDSDMASDACWGFTPNCNSGFGGSDIHFSRAWCNYADPTFQTCSSSDAIDHIWAVETAAHEMGHCYHGLDDEYELTNNCTHSNMGSPGPTNGPYLGRTGINSVDWCDVNNGGKDPEPGTTGHPTSANNWDCFANRYSNEVKSSIYTPDQFYQTGRMWTGDKPFDYKNVTITEHW